MRITEQPILVTKSKINRPGYKFLKYFRQHAPVLILVFVLESNWKGPNLFAVVTWGLPTVMKITVDEDTRQNLDRSWIVIFLSCIHFEPE